MRRRAWMAGTAASVALLARPRIARAATATRWTIEPSEAHDAIVLISYAGYPPEGRVRALRDPAARAFADRIPADAMQRVLKRFGYVFLDLYPPLLKAFDDARPRTLADLRAAIRTSAPHAPGWFGQSGGDLERIVDSLIAGGFSDYWRANQLPRATEAAERFRAALANADPAGAASRLLGTTAGDDMTVLVQGFYERSWYALPARRFLVAADADPDRLSRWLTDGLILDAYPLRDDAEVNRAVDALRSDRFITGTLNARNSHGEYFRDLRSYVHGCCVAALQLLAGDPPERMFWSRSGGIYVFANVLYEILAGERYASSAHGPFRETLLRLIGPDGPLAPGRVGPAYAKLVGAPPAPPWPGAPPLPNPANPR